MPNPNKNTPEPTSPLAEAGCPAQAGADAAAQNAERSLNRLAVAFRLSGEGVQQAVEQSAQNMQAITEYGSVLSHGVQDISREWLSFVQQAAQANVEGFGTLLRSRTPQDLAVAQSDLLRQNLEALLNSSARISERSAAIASETVQRIAARAVASGREARRT